jgi:hypothetical protein
VEVISGYQVGGASAGGQVPGWKMFHTAKMTDVRNAGSFAGPRPDYDPAKLRISVLCCRLDRVDSEASAAVGGEDLPQRLAGVAGGEVEADPGGQLARAAADLDQP